MVQNTASSGEFHATRDVEEPRALSAALPILIEYWNAALRWRWISLGIIGAALVVGLVLTVLTTPQYTSTSRIEISRDQKRVTNIEGLDTQEATNNLEFYQTQYSLLKARSLAERVAKRLQLERDVAFFGAHGVKSEATGGEPTTAALAARRRAAAVSLLLHHITVEPVRGSALVDIRYTSGSPEVSARIANIWVQEYIQSALDRRFASTADARRFLEARLDQLRAKLETSERALVNYAAGTGIVALQSRRDPDGKTQTDRTLVVTELETLSQALSTAIADRVAAESRAGGGQAASQLNDAALATLRQRRAEIAADYARLLVQFEPEYPAARALAAQVRTLDQAIAREEQRANAGRSTEYADAVQRENGLRARVEALKSQLGGQQRAGIQYNILQRDVDTTRQIYDGLLQRYKEIGAAGIGSNNIAVVDTAQPPSAPVSPRVGVNMLLALLGGITLAGIVVVALEQIDEGLRDPDDLDRRLGMPLLGVVPDAPEMATERNFDVIADSKSALSEAYLSLRSNLAFSSDHGVPRSFMLTSSRPTEGKSTSTVALATVLGRTGKRILVVDADMRSPSMHAMFGERNRQGLSNALAGEDNWREFIIATSSKNVSLLTAGPIPPSAAELLSSDRIVQIVQQLSNEYDHVVIDCPPVMGLADAPLLSRAVEGAIFIVQAGGAPMRAIKSSITRLHRVHANILGIVMTKLRRDHVGYGYGSGYGYGYGYGYGVRKDED